MMGQRPRVDANPKSTKIIGGGAVPNRSGSYVYISWPLVIMVVTSDLIALQPRFRWMRKLPGLSSKSIEAIKGQDRYWWISEIPQISCVRMTVDGRSLQIVSETGDCSFGFPAFPSGAELKADGLRNKLFNLGVPIEDVGSNLWSRGSMKQRKTS